MPSSDLMRALRERIAHAVAPATADDVAVIELQGTAVIQIDLGFAYALPEPGAGSATGRARVLLRVEDAEAFLGGGDPLPLIHAAGYEFPAEGCLEFLRQGAASSTPVVPEIATDASHNPAMRCVNLDVACLHVIRALPFVDVERLVLIGGSAGGYMGLMLAAESFPLGGAMLTSPVVNSRYHFNYIRRNTDVTLVNRDKLPVYSVILAGVPGSLRLFGGADRDELLDASSPATHLHRISCPIQVVHSTADVLVPFLANIGDTDEAGFDASTFPDGFVMDPAELGFTAGITRILDVARDAAVITVRIPRDSQLTTLEPSTTSAAATPPGHVSVDWPQSGWQVVIVDEGPPDPGAGHFKYVFGLDRPHDKMMAKADAVDVSQLTAAKLELLMGRLSGRPWISGKYSPLDVPSREERDVLGGLVAWCRSPERACRLAELYNGLPAELRILGGRLDPDLGAVRERLRATPIPSGVTVGGRRATPAARC